MAMHLVIILGCIVGFRLIAELIINEIAIKNQPSLSVLLLCAIWLGAFAVLANSLWFIRNELSMMWQ